MGIKGTTKPLAGDSMRFSEAWDWTGAFAALAGVALLSSVAAGIYLNCLRPQE